MLSSSILLHTRCTHLVHLANLVTGATGSSCQKPQPTLTLNPPLWKCTPALHAVVPKTERRAYLFWLAREKPKKVHLTSRHVACSHPPNFGEFEAPLEIQAPSLKLAHSSWPGKLTLTRSFWVAFVHDSQLRKLILAFSNSIGLFQSSRSAGILSTPMEPACIQISRSGLTPTMPRAYMTTYGQPTSEWALSFPRSSTSKDPWATQTTLPHYIQKLIPLRAMKPVKAAMGVARHAQKLPRFADFGHWWRHQVVHGRRVLLGGRNWHSVRTATAKASSEFADPRQYADMTGESAYGSQGESLFLTGLQGTAEERRQQLLRAYSGLLKMARPHNFGPSVVLVLLGAWLAAGRTWHTLLAPRVWLVAALSGMIAVTSMIANDVFDFRSGADKVNGPNKPLVTGQVHADDAELTAGCLYGAVVLGCSCLEPLPLRVLVSCSAVATYIYTPFLKRITLVKNAVVAAIIASSILAGGMAAGGYVGLQRTAVMGLFLFHAIMCREIVMDVSDVDGDRAAGIVTVPVRLGRRGGLLAAIAALVAAHITLIGGGPRSWPFIAVATLLLGPLYSELGALFRAPLAATPPLEKLSKFVDQSMIFIGGVLLLLSATL